MELAEVPIGLKLRTKLVMCLLPVKSLIAVFCRRGPYAVILVEVVDVGRAFRCDCR